MLLRENLNCSQRERQTLTTRDGSDSMLKDDTYRLPIAKNKLGITLSAHRLNCATLNAADMEGEMTSF